MLENAQQRALVGQLSGEDGPRSPSMNGEGWEVRACLLGQLAQHRNEVVRHPNGPLIESVSIAF